MTSQVNTPADSIIACADKCGFSSDDVALVQDWKTTNAAAGKAQQSTNGATANDMATTIPYVVVGLAALLVPLLANP